MDLVHECDGYSHASADPAAAVGSGASLSSTLRRRAILLAHCGAALAAAPPKDSDTAGLPPAGAYEVGGGAAVGDRSVGLHRPISPGMLIWLMTLSVRFARPTRFMMTCVLDVLHARGLFECSNLQCALGPRNSAWMKHTTPARMALFHSRYRAFVAANSKRE